MSPVSGTGVAAAGSLPCRPSGTWNSVGLVESVYQADRPVSTTSLMKDGTVCRVYDFSTRPLRTSMTRALPPEPPDTKSRPLPSSLSPSDWVPGPWLITSPRPVRRLAR